MRERKEGASSVERGLRESSKGEWNAGRDRCEERIAAGGKSSRSRVRAEGAASQFLTENAEPG